MNYKNTNENMKNSNRINELKRLRTATNSVLRKVDKYKNENFHNIIRLNNHVRDTYRHIKEINPIVFASFNAVRDLNKEYIWNNAKPMYDEKGYQETMDYIKSFEVIYTLKGLSYQIGFGLSTLPFDTLNTKQSDKVKKLFSYINTYI